MDDHSGLWMNFIDTHPANAAEILERLESEEIVALLEKTPSEIGAKVLRQMNTHIVTECLVRVSIERAASLLAEMDLDFASSVLRRIEEKRRTVLLEGLDPKMARHLELLLRYPDGTAGAAMDPHALAISSDVTVEDVLAQVRKSSGPIYYLYVTDREDLLLGYTTLHDLLQAPLDERISSVYSENLPHLRDRSDYQAILVHPGWNHFYALPVVDDSGMFLGVLRYEAFRRMQVQYEDLPFGPKAFESGRELGELFFHGLGSMILEGVSARPYRRSNLTSAEE